MATNVFAPSGFREGRSLQGVSPNYAVLTRYIAYNYATPIGIGDPVIITSTGTIQVLVAGTTPTQLDGIFLGCQFFNPQNPIQPFQPYWPGVALASGTIVLAKVAVDPHMTFYAQAANTTPFTQADVGKNIDISTGTPGAAGVPNIAGISQCALAATDNTTALPFRIVGILGLNDLSGGVAISPFYNPTLAYQWLEVSMNTSNFTTTTGI